MVQLLTYWSRILLDGILIGFYVRHECVDVGGNDLDKILRHCSTCKERSCDDWSSRKSQLFHASKWSLTVRQYSFVTLKRMHDSRCMITKTQTINAMCEIQWDLAKQRCDVYVAATKVNTFAAGDVEIARHFIQCQWAVYATGVERFLWFICALW